MGRLFAICAFLTLAGCSDLTDYEKQQRREGQSPYTTVVDSNGCIWRVHLAEYDAEPHLQRKKDGSVDCPAKAIEARRVETPAAPSIDESAGRKALPDV